MAVLNPVMTKLNAVNSKPTNHAALESSAVEARARLEQLGIGSSDDGELLKQHPQSNASVESESIPLSDYGGKCKIQRAIRTEASYSDTASSTGGIETHRANSAKLAKCAQSANYISNFHAYAISLFSVLVLSTWLFGYFILR